MLARSHRLCSIAIVELGLLATHNFLANPISDVIILAATGIGSSLPDIDNYNSKASRKSLINFSLLFRHRGITHSLLGFLLFSVGLYWLMSYFRPIRLDPGLVHNYWSCIWLGLVLGYLLHLLEDSFSNQGVAWFAPFIKQRSKPILHYKVGGTIEKAIAFLSLLGVTVMSIYCLWLLASMPKI